MKKVRLTLFCFGIAIIVLGCIMIYSNYFNLLINAIYTTTAICFLVFCYKKKKSKKIVFAIMSIVLFLTFGIKTILDFVAYYKYTEFVFLHSRMFFVLCHIPSLFFLIGFVLMLPYISVDIIKR